MRTSTASGGAGPACRLMFVAALCAAGAACAARADERSLAPAVSRSGSARVTEWPVPTPLSPRDPALDAHGLVHFAVAKGDRIGRFDPRTERFTEWPVPAGTNPHGVAVTADGKVYFGGYGSGTLNELDPATGNIRELKPAEAGSRIYSVVADREGNIWFTDRGLERVGRYHRASGAIATWPMAGEPYGIAQALDGKMWFTRLAADKLGIVDPGSRAISDVVLPPGSKPRRLAFASDGTVWVTLYGTGRLARVDPDTRKVLREFDLPGGPNCGPYSVAVDKAGRVWISLFQTDSVAILDPVANRIDLVALPEKRSGIRNATLGPDGRFWYIAATTGKLGTIR